MPPVASARLGLSPRQIGWLPKRTGTEAEAIAPHVAAPHCSDAQHADVKL